MATYSHTHMLVHSLTCLITRTLTQPLTHLLHNSLTHSANSVTIYSRAHSLSFFQGCKFQASLLHSGSVVDQDGVKFSQVHQWLTSCWDKLGHQRKCGRKWTYKTVSDYNVKGHICGRYLTIVQKFLHIKFL